MPKLSDAFPSKYIAADVEIPDIDEGGAVVTIVGAEFVHVGQGDKQERKLAVHLEEFDKPFLLNKTNASVIAEVLKSDDTDDWEGKRVKLYATDVQFGSDMVRGIRVSTRPVPAAVKPAAKGKPAPPPADDDAEITAMAARDEDDDIPFN